MKNVFVAKCIEFYKKKNMTKYGVDHIESMWSTLGQVFSAIDIAIHSAQSRNKYTQKEKNWRDLPNWQGWDKSRS